MNFKQTIFSIRGLTCQIMVNDGNENSNYSNFFKFWNGTLTLNYSMYLIFNINLDADGKVKKKGHVKSEESKKSRKDNSGMTVGHYIVLRYLGF